MIRWIADRFAQRPLPDRYIPHGQPGIRSPAARRADRRPPRYPGRVTRAPGGRAVPPAGSSSATLLAAALLGLVDSPCSRSCRRPGLDHRRDGCCCCRAAGVAAAGTVRHARDIRHRDAGGHALHGSAGLLAGGLAALYTVYTICPRRTSLARPAHPGWRDRRRGGRPAVRSPGNRSPAWAASPPAGSSATTASPARLRGRAGGQGSARTPTGPRRRPARPPGNGPGSPGNCTTWSSTTSASSPCGGAAAAGRPGSQPRRHPASPGRRGGDRPAGPR